MNEFGVYMREARTAKNMTLQSVANQAGCSRQFIWLVESGRYKPSQELVDKLVEILGLDRTKAHKLNGYIRPDLYDFFVQFQEELEKTVDVLKNYSTAFAEKMHEAVKT